MNRLATFFSSFTGRMMLGLLAMHVLLVPLLALGIYRIIAGDIEDEFVNHIRTQSRQLGLLLEERPSAQAAQPLLAEWLETGQVAHADIVGADGNVVEARAGVQPAGARFVEDFRFGEHGDDTYFIAVPVRSEGGAIRGTLRL